MQKPSCFASRAFSIARALHVSNNTVAEIRDQEWQQVAALQQRIAAQWRQVATKAIDRMNDRLDRKAAIPLRELIPLAGVATDKLIALDRTHQLPDLHAHLHQHLHITEEQAKAAAEELIASRLTSAAPVQPNQQNQAETSERVV